MSYHFDTQLWHTGQNYDYNLNGIFFRDLGLSDPELYLNAVGDDLGATMGNIMDRSYKAMVATKPDAILVLGDTNSFLSVIGAKRLYIWKLAIAARMSVCRRRPIGESSALFPM